MLARVTVANWYLGTVIVAICEKGPAEDGAE